MRTVVAFAIVALAAATLSTPSLGAEPSDPLFAVERQRTAVVARLANQWGSAFAALPLDRRLSHEQLSNKLWALRADRLFAATLAVDVESIEVVLAGVRNDVARQRSPIKALGDVTADLTYTPVNPCRILDTRSTPAGPLAPGVARTFDGYSSSFSSQGGTGSTCSIPNGVSALALNVYAVNPADLGFIKVWPANAPEPAVSTVNYQVGITAIATGALVPVDPANSNRFNAKSPATVDFIADVVGYFKPPGDAAGLDIKVAGQRVMRYEPTPISPNVIGGSPANYVAAGVRGATIAGGGVPVGDTDPDYVDEAPNSVTDVYGTVGGGYANRAGDNLGTINDAGFATVGGGYRNRAASVVATVGGGYENAAIGAQSTVAGGYQNKASGAGGTVGGGDLNTASGAFSTVVGGEQNLASGQYGFVGGGREHQATGNWSTLGGGWGNKATAVESTVAGGGGNTASGGNSFVGGGSSNSASGARSMVVGGQSNSASGDYSFASGRLAKAHEAGMFVWADSRSLFFDPTTFRGAGDSVDTFNVRATGVGGVIFVTGIDATSGAPTWGCYTANGAGWACTSDRNAKRNLEVVDAADVLARVTAIPIYRWQPKDGPNAETAHVGPMAQDFHQAFKLGDSNRSIGLQDADGIALAAVQGLNAKLEARLAEKDREIAELKEAVRAIREGSRAR